ncbi:MAG TPA: hypothetical protein VJ975_04100 [Candidatus Limnocylindria bacterium]|nr:hypothetical protein [Candidatus Limnocylindria bacterium]
MRTPTGRATVASVAVAAALLVAWLVPPLGTLLLWPLLVIVPGWGAMSLLQPRIDGAGRLGLAIVGSVALSTHLVYWLAKLTDDYSRGTVFLAASLLAAPIPLAAFRGVRPRRCAGGVLPVLALGFLAAALVGLTLGVGIWRVTPDGVSSGGSNWSDLGVHLSIAETLNAGANFPPEVPYFAGVPLTYHWFADFHAAILASAAGLFSVPAMVFQSALLAGALVLIVASLARRLVRGHDARRVALLAAALAVFGGGMGYIRFIGDIGAGQLSPLELITRNSYDNQWLTGWPYFRIPSVMGTGLLAHRATTAGLPMLIGAVLLLVAGLPTARQRAAGWRDRPWLIAAAGVLGALLAPFHFFFFPVFPLLAMAWVVAGRRLVEPTAARNALLLVAPYVLALPFVIAPALQAGGSGAVQLVSVWPSAPRDDGLAAVLFFYATNLGVPFVLALLALLVQRVPHRGFVAAWIIGLFLVPNVVQLSVIDFDMNKYFQAMWIAVAMLAAWLIRRWPAPAVAAVIVLSVPSPLLVAGWTATSNLQVLSTGELEAADWVAGNTPPDAVFVTDGWVNSLTDAAGRKRLTTFGPYVANLGYRPDERISNVTTIYCGGDAVLSAELMRRYGATYVVDGARPTPCPAPVDFASDPAFELVYDAGPRIWLLRDP